MHLGVAERVDGLFYHIDLAGLLGVLLGHDYKTYEESVAAQLSKIEGVDGGGAISAIKAADADGFINEMTDGYVYGKDIDTDSFYGDVLDGLRAIAHSQSFLNLQPYRIIVDDDQISLIALPDDQTTPADVGLNYGIVMFNFYAVMDAVRPQPPKWSFEPVTDRDLGLKDGATYIAKCKL